MVPKFSEIKVHVFVLFWARKFSIFNQKFFAYLCGSFLVHPILSELLLICLTALAIAATVHAALVLFLANCLHVETAPTVAAAMRIVTRLDGITFKHKCMSVQDQSIHELIILVWKVSEINSWLWNLIVLLPSSSHSGINHIISGCLDQWVLRLNLNGW